MGFFSFVTADTNESIPCFESGRSRPVYMLQPNGLPSILEPAYQGYGQFGGVNCYKWLGSINAPLLGLSPDLSEDELVFLGISLDTGYVLRRVTDGQLFQVFHPCTALPGIIQLPQIYSVPAKEFNGMSANDAVESGLCERIKLSSLYPQYLPLKFSFQADAVYESLPGSKACIYQGYFYEDAN